MKILVIRFGGISGVLLTTPIVRCIKKQLPEVELHFLVAVEYKALLANNPYIDATHIWFHGISVTDELKAKNFNEVIDLQNNADSRAITKRLKTKTSFAANQNFQKFVFTNLKINIMPHHHDVDRNIKTVAHLGVQNDGADLDFFLTASDETKQSDIPASHHLGYMAAVIGSSKFTKRMPVSKWQELCKKINHPIILLGDKHEKEAGDAIASVDEVKIYNACGKFSLHECASLLRQSKLVITHDTGLMHIAAAMQKPTITIWGSTKPSLGKAPYYGAKKSSSINISVENLWCRPCTVNGKDACPLGHFKCMKNIDVNKILEAVQSLRFKV